MYSRVTLVEIDTLRIGMDEALELYREAVLPRLSELDGYLGVLVMANPDGVGMLVTLWETEEAALAGGFYYETLERFVTFFRQPSGRDHYEVVLAELPALIPDT